MSEDRELDATGLNCPMPVLRAKKALKDLPAGGRLTVLATDAGAPRDFENFCETAGLILAEQSEQDGTYRFVLQKPST
jgi:tRNA 2-thiouridine synthesizing protein A